MEGIYIIFAGIGIVALALYLWSSKVAENGLKVYKLSWFI